MPNMRTAMAWEVCRDRKRRCLTVLRHAVYIADISLSRERGEITYHMGGRSAATVMLHILRRLHMSPPPPVIGAYGGLFQGRRFRYQSWYC